MNTSRGAELTAGQVRTRVLLALIALAAGIAAAVVAINLLRDAL